MVPIKKQEITSRRDCYSGKSWRLLDPSSFGASSLSMSVVVHESAVRRSNSRVLLVERALPTLLQINVEDVVITLARNYHNLRTIVAQCDYRPHGSS